MFSMFPFSYVISAKKSAFGRAQQHRCFHHHPIFPRKYLSCTSPFPHEALRREDESTFMELFVLYFISRKPKGLHSKPGGLCGAVGRRMGAKCVWEFSTLR